MMNPFDYAYPVRVHFGAGTLEKSLEAELPQYGKNVLLAYGGGSIKRTGVYDKLKNVLRVAGKEVFDFGGIMSNPTYAKVQEGAKLAKEHGIDFILAVGGGSVIDCCKVVSVQAKTNKDIWTLEYEEKGKPAAGIPFGAIVTASGTGAEMNNGAVITNEERGQKSPLWGSFADFAILDVETMLTLPKKQVISGAFDTLSHAMETYLGTPRTSNLSDEMGEAVMRSVIRNLRRVVKDEKDVEARSELAWASAMAENGILKLGKTTDFQAHMIEHQLGAFTNCNHGAGLAVIHPALYRHLAKAAPKQFARLATEVFGVEPAGRSEEELALAMPEALTAFIKEIGMPMTLTELGITDDNILRKTADTCILTSGCAKKLTRDEVYEILQECK